MGLGRRRGSRLVNEACIETVCAPLFFIVKLQFLPIIISSPEGSAVKIIGQTMTVFGKMNNLNHLSLKIYQMY